MINAGVVICARSGLKRPVATDPLAHVDADDVIAIAKIPGADSYRAPVLDRVLAAVRNP